MKLTRNHKIDNIEFFSEGFPQLFLVSRSERSRDSGSHNVCLSVCLSVCMYVCMSQTLIRFYSMNSSVNSSMISSINQKY